MASELTLVVVAFHRPDSLDRLLSTLGSEVPEVLVVNVEADPMVAEVCSSIAGVEEVPLAGNPGYAVAVNLGCTRASKETVIFCNDDVWYAPGALSVLGQTVADTGAVVAPALVDEDGRPLRSVVPNPGIGRFVLEWVLLPDRPFRPLSRLPVEKWRLPQHRERVPGVAAAVVGVPRDVLLEWPLPEQYFLYWEEREWFLRLAHAGIPVYLEPMAKVHHLGSRAVRSDKQMLLAANAVRYFERTGGPLQRRAAHLVVGLWQLRLVLTGMLALLSRRPEARSSLLARCAGLATVVRQASLARCGRRRGDRHPRAASRTQRRA